jgi:hypothetical protein
LAALSCTVFWHTVHGAQHHVSTQSRLSAAGMPELWRIQQRARDSA